MLDWVLVEIPIDNMRVPMAGFSAFIEAPFDALEGVGPTDWLPIQGVALDIANDDDYVTEPVIAFPPVNIDTIGDTDEEKKVFSLRVDMTQFAADAVVRIGLYGYIATYYITGGDGNDNGLFGDVFTSEWYGTLTRRYEDVDPITPEGLAGAARYLKIASGLNPFGHDRLVSTFPELSGVDYEYSGVFPTGNVWGLLWGWNPDLARWDEESIGTLDPEHDPNAFIIYTPNVPDVTTFWTGDIIKTSGSVAGTVNITIGPVPTLDNQESVPTPPPTGKTSANIQGADNMTYYVPTWEFKNSRTAPLNVAFSALNIWVEFAQIDYNGPSRWSRTWETTEYPDRPEMAQINTVTVPWLDPDPDADWPVQHFGHGRIGTLTLYRGSGLVTFEPVETPVVDGTPDGDGAIGDGTAPGRTDNPVLRAWTFSLDGHDYYVLRLGDFDEVIYDLYSEQWMDWNDFNSLTWRAHCGTNWIGAEALGDTYGSNVLAGDDTYGLLWFLDPNQPFDDDPLGGATPSYFSRVTVGQVNMNGREVLPCYVAWLTTDMGAPAYSGAAVSLWTSDDAGATWDNQGFVQVTTDENTPELSWYSLGQIAAPGRLFKIFDDGAITRIDSLQMNDPDDQK